MPEGGLVAILDADKEGFLRSEGSPIQTMGARRNAQVEPSRADTVTGSMQRRWMKARRRSSWRITMRRYCAANHQQTYRRRDGGARSSSPKRKGAGKKAPVLLRWF